MAIPRDLPAVLALYQGEASLEPIPSGVGDVRAVLLYLCGRRAADVLRAVFRSVGRPGGTATTSSQRSSAGTTARLTASFYTPSAIVNCIAVSATTAAASRQRRLEGLSRVSWKLSPTVLRGAVGGNADCLLDPKEGKPPKQPYAFELSSGNLFALAGIWIHGRMERAIGFSHMQS